jgi:hypothetical protein
LKCFDGAEWRVLRAQDHGIDPFLAQHAQNLFTPDLAQVIGEEASVSNNNT